VIAVVRKTVKLVFEVGGLGNNVTYTSFGVRTDHGVWIIYYAWILNGA